MSSVSEKLQFNVKNMIEKKDSKMLKFSLRKENQQVLYLRPRYQNYGDIMVDFLSKSDIFCGVLRNIADALHHIYLENGNISS